jgi:hypothetical protein
VVILKHKRKRQGDSCICTSAEVIVIFIRFKFQENGGNAIYGRDSTTATAGLMQVRV